MGNSSAKVFTPCTKALKTIKMIPIKGNPGYYNIQFRYLDQYPFIQTITYNQYNEGNESVKVKNLNFDADNGVVKVEFTKRFISKEQADTYISQITKKGACLSCLNVNNCSCIDNNGQIYRYNDEVIIETVTPKVSQTKRLK